MEWHPCEVTVSAEQTLVLPISSSKKDPNKSMSAYVIYMISNNYMILHECIYINITKI